jgi:hypothetical protein
MLERCLRSLAEHGFEDVVVIDNDSEVPLEESWYRVVRADNTHRHLAPWALGLVPKDDWYIVCDCDIEIDDWCPDDVGEYLKACLDSRPDLPKVGLGINTENFVWPWPYHYVYSYAMELAVEDRYPRSGGPLDGDGFPKPLLEAPIDTHFAMHRPGTVDFPGIGGARTTGVYTCTHLPWGNAEYTDEERLYYSRMPDWALTHSASSVVPHVVVPFTELRAETSAALQGREVTYSPMLTDESYFELLSDCWAAKRSFIVVEHDIVVEPWTIDELAACPEDWCSMGYPYRGDPAAHGLACTKFSDRLIARHPETFKWVDLLRDDSHEPRHWCRMDAWLWHTLTKFGEKRHEHPGVVGHLGPQFPRHGCLTA